MNCLFKSPLKATGSLTMTPNREAEHSDKAASQGGNTMPNSLTVPYQTCRGRSSRIPTPERRRCCSGRYLWQEASPLPHRGFPAGITRVFSLTGRTEHPLIFHTAYPVEHHSMPGAYRRKYGSHGFAGHTQAKHRFGTSACLTISL